MLRNGDGIGDHLNRFQPGGKYSGLKAKEWCVVDIRDQGADACTAQAAANKMVVYVSINFESITITYGADGKTLLDSHPLNA